MKYVQRANKAKWCEIPVSDIVTLRHCDIVVGLSVGVASERAVNFQVNVLSSKGGV